MPITTRSILITGASRGIGLAIAERFAHDGHSLVLVARDSAELAAAVSRCRELGAPCESVPTDLTDANATDALIKRAPEVFGPVEVLVCNAGIAESAPLSRTDDAMLQRHLELNTFSVLRLMRALVPAMVEREFGRVVAIASVAGKHGAPYIAAYSASKHATLGLIRSAAAEVARRGVTVNAICPGYVNTPMTENVLERIESQTGLSAADSRAALEKQSPQNRMFEPAEVADLCAFLVSDAAHGINGQAINLDGGQYAY